MVVMKTQLQFHTIPGLTWDCLTLLLIKFQGKLFIYFFFNKNPTLNKIILKFIGDLRHNYYGKF